MAWYSRFKIKDWASNLQSEKDSKKDQTYSSSDVVVTPVDTIIEKDDGTRFKKNSKGAWDTVSTAAAVSAHADALTDARRISLGGDATGYADFDGSQNVTIPVSITTSYNDLTNKPTIPTVPTSVSAFTNDAGYLTSHQDLSSYATQSYVNTAVSNLVNGANASFDTLKEIQDAMATDAELATAISNLSIPSTTSALTNDSGFATQTYVDTAIANNSSSIDISSTAPTGASSGDLWWDDVDGLLNVYYDGAWVEASPASGSVAQGAGSGLDADLLDGLQASQFVRTDANSTVTGNNRITFGPNSTWGANLVIGGNGNGSGTATASVVTTNGNIHIDPANGAFGTYLNWYNGTSGTYFGNGASVQVGRVDSSGNATFSGDVTAYSDNSLKTNVQPIQGALSKVEQVTGVTFERITDGSVSTGVVAQELEAVLPEAVKTDDAGLKHVAYGNITGLLIEAVKELDAKYQDQIKQLTDQIEELKRNG